LRAEFYSGADVDGPDMLAEVGNSYKPASKPAPGTNVNMNPEDNGIKLHLPPRSSNKQEPAVIIMSPLDDIHDIKFFLALSSVQLSSGKRSQGLVCPPEEVKARISCKVLRYRELQHHLIHDLYSKQNAIIKKKDQT